MNHKIRSHGRALGRVGVAYLHALQAWNELSGGMISDSGLRIGVRGDIWQNAVSLEMLAKSLLSSR